MSTEMHVLKNWYNGHRLVRYVSIIEPIPAKAIRIRTSDGQSPVKATYTRYDRYEKVDGYDDVYDVFTDYSSWDYILAGCSNLQEVLGSNPTGITSCYAPFGNSSLVTVTSFDIGTVAAQRIFDQCSNLISVALFDTSSITDGASMFDTCTSLISVPLFDFSNVTNTQNMFRDCAALSYIPAFVLSSVSNCRDMFNGCRNVQSGALAVYNQLVETVTTPFMYAGTFKNCGIDTVTGAAELAQIPQDWGGNAMSFKTVTIGNQTWMSENLAIDDGGSGIYTGNVVNNGVSYGTQYYYTPGAAIRVANTIDGWHVPNSGDWTTLKTYVGSASAAKVLKTTAGWKSTGNGLDTYGFSALPVGYYNTVSSQYKPIGVIDIGSQVYYSMSGMYPADVAGRYYNAVGLRYDYDKISTVAGLADFVASVRLVHD